MRILIVEDNVTTAQYLSKGLQENYFTVDISHDGQEGLFLASNNSYDVIIFDVMLPLIDGWSLLKTFRELNNKTPVLFLTARDSVEDRVKGLELGADDYLIKPFAFSELLARIRSILRRNQTPSIEVLELHDLKINTHKHQVTRQDIRINLTAKEFKLLLLFAKREGEILSRTFIAEQVWDINFDSDTNAIDVAIKRLRDKIDSDFPKKLIHNVRGVGYVLEAR